MPLYHCNECPHEWQGTTYDLPVCDWCGAVEHVIQEMTELERMLSEMMLFGGFGEMTERSKKSSN
jgi:hypothetical protein